MDIKKIKELTLSQHSFGLLLVTVFLLPIFLLPIFNISIDYTKNVLLQISAVVSVVLWLVSRLRVGKLIIPRTYLLYFIFLIPFAFLISSFYSSSFNISIFGFGNEVDTFVSILTLFLVMLLSSIYFQKTSRIFCLYSGILISFVILSVYHILRLAFGVDFLSFGVLNFPSSSIIGKWNDVAVFSGLSLILSLFALYLPNLGKKMKILMFSVLIVSLFFVALINFSLIWLLVGIFSLLLFVYTISFLGDHSIFEDKKFKFEISKSMMLPLAIVVLSVLFLVPGNPAGNFLASKFNVSNIEARPSWGATISVVKGTWSNDAILGSGPNRFSQQWNKFKTSNINQTAFWKTNFNLGVGIIPSFAVTTGILGIVLWAVFLAWLLFIGGKFAITKHENRSTHYLVFSSFVLTLYLWLVTIFYVPGVAMFALAFVMTGVFISSLVKSGSIKNIEFSFLDNQKVGFISVLLIIILMITSVVGGYFFTQRFISAYIFNKGVREFNTKGDIVSSEPLILKASKLFKSDIYYRALTEVQITKLNFILSKKNVGEEKTRVNFQDTLGNAIKNAKKAISVDKTNYLNWILLGKVYESIVLAGVDGAYENAVSAYNQALVLNPTSPEVHLVLARVEISRGKLDKSKEHISKAIEMKGNYTEAIFLLSQIQASEGNLDNAIKTVQKASILSPNDIGVFFQLGFLRYQDKDYSGAISALERAVILQPGYSNAKYFLGLSYAQTGRENDAIAQFKDIEYLNPNNTEIKKILNNLTNNVPLFENSPTKLPEKRDKLPLEE
jgi:tetratricopeptide (TPR) repeat protein